VSSVNIRSDVEPTTEFKFQFIIIPHPEQKPIYLAASREETFKWIEKIDQAIANPNAAPSPAPKIDLAVAVAKPDALDSAANTPKKMPAHPLDHEEEDGGFTKL